MITMMPDWWVVPGLEQTSDDLQVPEPQKWASLSTVILVTEKFYAYGIFIGHGYKNWLLQVWILSQGYLSPALCDSHYLEPEPPPGRGKEDCGLLPRQLWELLPQKGNTWFCPLEDWFYPISFWAQGPNMVMWMFTWTEKALLSPWAVMQMGLKNVNQNILATVESSINSRVKSRTWKTDFSQIMKSLNARLREMDCNLSFGGK